VEQMQRLPSERFSARSWLGRWARYGWDLIRTQIGNAAFIKIVSRHLASANSKVYAISPHAIYDRELHLVIGVDTLT